MNNRLNALVAEHIMGGWYTTNVKEYRWLCCAREFCLIPADMNLPIGESGCGQIPAFTTDPVASEALLDKMAADGWSWRLSGSGVKGIRFACRFAKSGKHFLGTAATRHLAIVLAALRAKGVEVE